MGDAMIRITALLAALLLGACVTDGNNLTSDPDPIEAARLNTQLGIDYMRKGYFELALEKLERAVDQNEDNAVAHSALAYLYSRNGEIKKADKHYRRAISLDKDNPDTHNNYGGFLCAQNRREEGEKHLLIAAQNPRFASPAAAWTNAGDCVRSVAPERAERYLREALRLDSEYSEALAQLAWISYDRREYLRARAFLQRFEHAGTHLPHTLWLATQTERQLGDVEAARRYVNMLRKQFPESEQAYDLGKSK